MAAFFMPMTPYLVSEFAKPTITNLVRECFGYDFPDIFSKDQVDYLFTYLTCLKAKTVLLEFNYVDKDYLEDFSRYYVKRFGNDGHKCARLHFFSSSVDHRTITSILERGNDAKKATVKLNKSYLGFMVIKPLPRTFIGKTCLKVMPDARTKRKLKRRLAREYNVDLFGISLQVNSIAFQEQDKVVAACATTAIWASLHALKMRSTRSIHSCSEITINALNHVEDSSNSFPSLQLSNKQILRSLDVEGVRYHAKSMEAPDERYFMQSVIAHIDSSLPMILTGEVFTHVPSIPTKPSNTDATSGSNSAPCELASQDLADSSGGQTAKPVFRARGGHAICVVGYKVDRGEDVLYVHDDRLGPYARAKLIGIGGYNLVEGEAPRDIKWALGLQRMNEAGRWDEPHELITPDFSVVPCDRKARLPFIYVFETCNVIIDDLKSMALASGESLARLEYQIELREISDIRSEVLKHEPTVKTLNGDELRKASSEEVEAWQAEKVKFLTTSYARLQWVVSFNWLGTPLFKVLIDASEIPQGDAVSAILAYDICLGNVLLDLIRESAAHPDQVEVNSGHFYQSFLRRLKTAPPSRMTHLDQTYGSPRAPKNLRESEFEGGNIVLNKTLETLYEPNGKGLLEMFQGFAGRNVDNLIWAVSLEGDLLIAEEYDGRGHPSITGFKPARIAGEIRHSTNGDTLLINVESGRYSRDYNNRSELLENAKKRFERYFPEQAFEIQVVERR